MSISPRWIATKELIEHPEPYSQYQVILGDKYSLIGPHESAVPNYSHFYGVRIHESFRLHNCLHILIHVDSLEEFDRLRNKLHVDAMSLPGVSEGDSVPVENYVITSILPNGSHVSFSEVVRT